MPPQGVFSIPPGFHLAATSGFFARRLLPLLLAASASSAPAAAPFVHTQPPARVRSTSAMLRGMVAPNGQTTQAWFEWGARGGYGQATAPVNVGAGAGVVPLAVTISNLTNTGIYQCRLVASNASGLRHGSLQVLTTGRKVAAWGANWSGQTNFPPGLSNTVAIAGCPYHAFGLKADGTLRGWGNNDYGKADPPADLTDVLAMAGGYYYSLVLRTDGTLRTWGEGPNGEKNPPPGLANIQDIAGGWYHCLALKSNGTVVAWGKNDYGQADVPSGLSNVVAVAAGGFFSLGLMADGRPVAWGENISGLTNVPPHLTNIVAIAAGTRHALALKSDGTVAAWGYNVYGQTDVPPHLTNAVAIAAGDDHSLALTTAGEVVAWGDSSQGEGQPPEGISNVVAVAAGAHYSLVIKPNWPPRATPTTVFAIVNHDKVIPLSGVDPDKDALGFRLVTLPGSGTLYQYVNGARGAAITSPNTVVSDAEGRVIFVPAPGAYGNPCASFEFAAGDGEELSPAAAVTIMVGRPYAFTQAASHLRPTTATLNGMATPNGLASWAWFEWGPRGTCSNRTGAAAVGSGAGVVRISSSISGLQSGGQYQGCLVVSNAAGVVRGTPHVFTTGMKVKVWGDSTHGLTNVPPNAAAAVALAAGSTHLLALKPDGTVVAWGDNTYNQTNIPARATNVVAIAAYGYHSLALKEDGTVVAWGDNFGNQNTIPAHVTNVVAVADGNGYCLALRADGTLVGWGENSVGQTDVPAWATNVVALAAGDSYNAVVLADGTVVGWGYIGYPEPGVTNVPADLKNVVGVASSGNHSLALLADGTVRGWGYSGFGQTTPPAGLTHVVGIAAAGVHSHAWKADGSIVSWGYGFYGQTTPPPGLSNVVGIATSSYNSLALVPNPPPTSLPQTVTGEANRDLLITLAGTDPDGDPLTFRVATLPETGALYQYADGGRGAAITLPDTPVTDGGARVVFVPEPNEVGNPYTTFTFSACDATSCSVPSTVGLGVVAPPQPQLIAWELAAGGAFQLHFTGGTNSRYRVWASTDLVDWQPVGAAEEITPGAFRFVDSTTPQWSRRFYRAGAP